MDPQWQNRIIQDEDLLEELQNINDNNLSFVSSPSSVDSFNLDTALSWSNTKDDDN